VTSFINVKRGDVAGEVVP